MWIWRSSPLSTTILRNPQPHIDIPNFFPKNHQYHFQQHYQHIIGIFDSFISIISNIFTCSLPLIVDVFQCPQHYWRFFRSNDRWDCDVCCLTRLFLWKDYQNEVWSRSRWPGASDILAQDIRPPHAWTTEILSSPNLQWCHYLFMAGFIVDIYLYVLFIHILLWCSWLVASIQGHFCNPVIDIF